MALTISHRFFESLPVWLGCVLAIAGLDAHVTCASDPILIYAGAGFCLPIEEAARIFTEREGIEVEATFAGSGCLLAQAELAGKGDVFIPGELHYLEQAEKRGVTHKRHERYELAFLTPAIVVAKGNPRRISTLRDLCQLELRIGLGDPKSVAVGIAAERWIEQSLSAGEAAFLRDNTRTRAINVNELGSQLTLGALDAAIVWDATVHLFPKIEAVCVADHEMSTTITGGILAYARQPEAAHRFLSFLKSHEGSRIFDKYGYQSVIAYRGSLGHEGGCVR